MAILEITNSTTVGNFNDTIKALQEAQKKASSAAEKERLQQFITKYTTSRDKLISVCKNDIIKGNMKTDLATKIEIGKLTRDSFEALSLERWNKLIDTPANQEHKTNEINATDKGQAFADFIDGKSGITLMTGVKATLATGAIAALSSLNISAFVGAMGFTGAAAALPTSVSIISIVPEIIAALFALNPVLGVAAGALAGIGAVKLVKKIFGPEIKKMWTNIKVSHKVKKMTESAQDKISSEQDLKKAMDGLTPEEYEEKAIERDKAVNHKYDDQFKDEAIKLIGTDPAKLAGEVKKLMTKYGKEGKVEHGDMINILQNVGIYVEDPNLGSIAKELKGDADFKKTPKGATPTTARASFNDFKKDYNKIIKMLADPTIPGSKKNKAITDLQNFAKDRDRFLDKSDLSNPAAPASTTADNERADKLIQLCQGMTELAKEMFAEILKDASRAADMDALKSEIEQKHGLDENQIKNL